MQKIILLFTILALSAALPLIAQPQQQESLGDLARQLREQHDKDAKRATKVFTNDNLPEPKPGETISSSPAPPESPSTPATTSQPATPPPSQETSGKPPESSGDKAKTKDYWQGKFKAARQDVAKAKEQQQLAEDELNLLQIQQAREIDPNTKADLTSKIQAKQSEIDTNKTATEAAQKALDDLEKDFKDSGAPDDWSHTD
jgi:type IV secretory pathway VirB10-like protein